MSSVDRPGQNSAAPLWKPFDEARQEGCFARHDEFAPPLEAGGKHLFGEPVRIELREGPGATGLPRLRGQAGPRDVGGIAVG